MKRFLPRVCPICLRRLWFDTITSKRAKNYIFDKGKYYCKYCYYKKLHNAVLK